MGSRTPLVENPIPGDEANPWKGRDLVFIPRRGSENAWACTPTSSSALAKANNHRQSLHCTPPRTRKRSGRKLLASSSEIEAGRLLAPGGGSCDTEAMDRDPNSASKSSALLFPTPCTSSSQHAAMSKSVLENFGLERDQDFWRDHNVQVIVRIRPLNVVETAANGTSTCLRQESPQALAWSGQPESRFTFDHVACASTTQEELFQVAGLPMVENCIKGYNSTIFAYGQTGSGKTHTMLGHIEGSNQKLSPNCGMTPRIFEYLFTRVKMEEASHKQDHLTFTCKCSFLEIYNEQITDLLEPTSTNLQIHENPKKGIFVENLKEIEVKNVSDVTNLLLQGAANRRVAQTRMNQESSRSHSVFTCVIESQCVSDSVTCFRYGRLNLVDLAGSERQKASGAEGERLREAANINKSLSTLGLVIMILVDVAQGKQRHVPYRDSKLTFLLQDSLGGNSKTTIIATVSPAISCANETLSTLKFAQRAKFIQNNAIVNEDACGDVKALQQQIQELKEELEQLRGQTQPSRSLPLADTQMEEIDARYSGRVEEENELLGVNRQLNSLLEAYERDLEYAKTMLQLKEDKIQRLKRVEDSVLSVEDCLQEENRALQRELHLLKDRMNKHPELLRFAFENKQLIQQLRSQEELYGKKREMLSEELASLRKQVLNSRQGNATPGIHMDLIDQDTQLKKVHQSTHPKRLVDVSLLLPDEDSEICNNIKNVIKSQGDQMDIDGYLEEGAQALDEALQQIKSMPDRHTFAITENQPVNLIQANTIHRNADEIRCFLQQAFDMSKEIESQFKVLCDGAVGENKRKRTASKKMMLADWGGKRLRALQSDATDKIDASGVHSHGTKEQANGEATSNANYKSQDGQNSSDWSMKVICESQKGAHAKSSNETNRRYTVVDGHAKPHVSEAEAKQQAHSHSIELALALMQELLHIERQKSLTHNEFDEGVLEQLQNRVTDICRMLEDEGQEFNALCTLAGKLQVREKQRTAQNIDLKRQVLKLQSDAVAREKEIAALQEEERTLATIVDKLHKGEEGLTTRLLSLTEHLECSEKQRAWGERLYKQKLHEIEENHFEARLKLQKLIAEIIEDSDKFRSVKKRLKMTLKNFRMVSNTKRLTEEALKAYACSGDTQMEADSLDNDFKLAYRSISQMQKQLIVMEREMTNVMTSLEVPLADAQNTWREEKVRILEELDKTKLDAAEKIGEASEALERFKHGQTIIREAELMVNTLTKGIESAREQQLALKNQWHEERESWSSEIADLKSLVAEKEELLQMKDKELQQTFSTNTIAKALTEIRSLVPEHPEHQERRDPTLIANVNHENMISSSLSKEVMTSFSLLALQRYDEGATLLLGKLEGIVATLPQKQGGVDAWIRFLNSFALALSKLEEDASSCLSFSNVICETLDKTLAEKQHLQEELKRKQELLKGSFFDLSLLQESTADYLTMRNKLDSVQAELDIRDEKIHTMEEDYATLKNENVENTRRALFLETNLLESEQNRASLRKENAEMRQNMENAAEKIVSLETMLEDRRQATQKLELELSDMNLLMEQKVTHLLDNVREELGFAIVEKKQLESRLASLEKQLDTSQLAADTNKRLVDEAQESVETSMRCIREKTAEIENMEKSIHELESTINALEGQIEILKRDAELQQLSREDLEMGLQALQHQQYHHDVSSSSKEMKAAEIIILRQELAQKSSEIKSLTQQVKELMIAAEMQATAHHQKLISLEAMADNINPERGHSRMLSPTTKKAGERHVGKCSTSPFKCINSGLAQQISFEIDEELYSNRCRIDELQDLAASRQKEIFRLNKKLAEAETMTYDVIRDLLGVKSDITTHALNFDHKDLEELTKGASFQANTAMDKEKELEALRDRYHEDKARWLEDSGRRQAEVLAARFAMEKLRQKDFLLKGENKRLKADLCKQKKRMLRVQEKMRASCEQEHLYHHYQGDLRRAHTLLNHDLGRER